LQNENPCESRFAEVVADLLISDLLVLPYFKLPEDSEDRNDDIMAIAPIQSDLAKPDISNFRLRMTLDRKTSDHKFAFQVWPV
jgi:hypothetical protein